VNRTKTLQLLNVEQAKSERLLLNILPKDIADRLKLGEKVIADHFEEASILFADIVNFTPLTSSMAPDRIVAILNDVFSQFDLLVEKHSLEKIKTIGDCYMAAAGIPKPRSDHAHAAVRLALDMREYVENHTFRSLRLSFRIGVNSGPVIAGVIGRKKFSYDLWGDAVNTASRMESHSNPGIIQTIKGTYELIKNEFKCTNMGKRKIKGKGELDIYYIEGYL
jgi:guanylate cyclase